MHFTAVAERFN